jgi:hypothetical protein
MVNLTGLVLHFVVRAESVTPLDGHSEGQISPSLLQQGLLPSWNLGIDECFFVPSSQYKYKYVQVRCLD